MLKLVVPATSKPVTPDEVKTFVRIDNDVENAGVESLLAAATNWVENYCHIAICTQTWEMMLERFPPFGVRFINIPRPPLQFIDSVKYKRVYDEDWNTFENYGTDEYTNRLFLKFAHIWPIGVWEPSGGVIIRFTCGYGDDGTIDASRTGQVPEAIRQAILILCDTWYENREAVTDGRMTQKIPFSVESLLSPYRWVTF